MEARVELCGGDCPFGEIAGLLRECFQTFSEWRVTAEDLELYRRVDPAVARGFHVYARIEGHVVSHVQVVVRRLAVGEARVPVCGVANVATHPRWRGRGLAKTLLGAALAECRRRRVPLAGLYTGFLSAAHHVYRSLGFYDVSPARMFGAHMLDVQPPVAGGVEVRPLVRGDAERLARVYREAAPTFGWVTAEREGVEERVFDRRFYHTFFYDEPGSTVGLAAERGGRFTGYVLALHRGSLSRPQGDRAAGLIYELVALDVPSLLALYGEAVERLRGAGARKVWVSAPATPRYSAVTGALWEVRGGGTYMSALLDGEALVEALAPELSRRLEEAGVWVRGGVDIGGLGLGFDGYGVGPGGGGRVDVGVGDLLRLVHGAAGFAGLAASGRAVPRGVSGGVLRGLAAAFPGGGMHVWPVDEW